MTRPSLEDFHRTPAPDLWPEIDRRLHMGSDAPSRLRRTGGGSGRAQRWVLVAASLVVMVLMFTLLDEAFLTRGGRVDTAAGRGPIGTSSPLQVVGLTYFDQSMVPTHAVYGFGSVWLATNQPLERYALIAVDGRSGAVLGRVGLPGVASTMAVGIGSLWVAIEQPPELLQVDPSSRRVIRRIGLTEPAAYIAITSSSVWLPSATGMDIVYPPSLSRSIAFPWSERGPGARLLVSQGDSVWAIECRQYGAWRTQASRLDSAGAVTLSDIQLHRPCPQAAAAAGGSLWLMGGNLIHYSALSSEGAWKTWIARIEPSGVATSSTLSLDPFRPAFTNEGLAVVGGEVIAMTTVGPRPQARLDRIDASSGRQIGSTIAVSASLGREQFGIVWAGATVTGGAGSVWLLFPADPELVRLQPCHRFLFFWHRCSSIP